MFRLAAPLAVVLALAASTVAGSSQAATHATKSKTLYGEAGPGLKIRLTFRDLHRVVRRLKAGRYSFMVQDRSTTVNFHLVGPGVNKKTPIDYLGFKRWKLRLKSGTYRYFSDSHPKKMKGSFVVR